MGIKINQEVCNGCGDCVDSCPTEAISLQDGKAVLNEDECADCGACEDDCPTGAITSED